MRQIIVTMQAVASFEETISLADLGLNDDASDEDIWHAVVSEMIVPEFEEVEES